jgi:hypothetical protein
MTGLLFTATAQKLKVKRKGVIPIEVNKKPPVPDYTLSQLEGKWQEVKRTAVKAKKELEFTDTLLMKINGNRVELKDATSMNISMKGFAEIEAPNFLIAAGDEYTIVSLDTARLILYDGEIIKELEKKKQYYYETFGKLTVVTETLNTPITVDPKNIEGKWVTYRKQALAGSVDKDAVLIKSLEILPSDRTGSALGQVVFYKSDVSETMPCKIIFGKGNILVITDKYNWDFNTYKADGNEFVFGETGVFLYYSKRL